MDTKNGNQPQKTQSRKKRGPMWESQIPLEEWQWKKLRAIAARENRSVTQQAAFYVQQGIEKDHS